MSRRKKAGPYAFGEVFMANVHKDFHGALSYGLQFVEDNYGREGLDDFLSRLAESVYLPLVDGIRARGLDALREHWQTVFDLEQGEFEMHTQDGVLTLRVHRCPAIGHMKERGYAIADHFCEHTRIVNEAVCKAAGYCSSVEYDQDGGRCVQRFWKEAP